MKILCVCKGNSDRSPFMAAVLQMYLDRTRAGTNQVVCESAGTLELASKGGCASPFAVEAAKRLGLDISGHRKRQVTPDLLASGEYDLFICADEEIAGVMVMEHNVPLTKVHNVQVSNPWPCQRQEDYDGTAERIMAAMYRVLRVCLPSEQ